MARCNAIIASGPNKGTRCRNKSKYARYCGTHKSIVIVEASKMTKTQRLALISGLGVSLITLAEKGAAHLPAVIEIIFHISKLPFPMKPEPDPQKFNELLADRTHWKEASRDEIFRDARTAVQKGEISCHRLDDLRRLVQKADTDWPAKEKFEELFELLQRVEEIR